MRKRIVLSLLALLTASFALYSSSVPIGVIQGAGDTSLARPAAMPTALANAGFTNVTVINLDQLVANQVDLTKYKVVVYAPDIYLSDSMAYKKVASQFTKVARLLHAGKINVLMMGQPYTHVYDYIPFYQCTYSCSGASKSTWEATIYDPNHALLKYPNVLTQANITAISTGYSHYIASSTGNMDGRVIAGNGGNSNPQLAELRWGTGKVLVSTWSNDCVGLACAAPYYAFLQNAMAYLSSVDVSGPVRATLDGTTITVSATAGQGATAKLSLPAYASSDATEKTLSGNQANFTLSALYPGQYIIKAEIYNAAGNRTGEGYYRIGFVTTSTAPRIALIEPLTQIETEYGLDMAGYSYSVFDGNTISKLNLSNFDLLMYDKNINANDANTYALYNVISGANMRGNVTAWVNQSGGKVILYHQYGVYPDTYAPISTPGGVYSGWSCSAWSVTILQPSHPLINYPHLFDSTNLNTLFSYWCHRIYNGINGIEGEHPFSHDAGQSYQDIGIKTYGSGKLIFTVLEPQWLMHSYPGFTEKQHDNQIYFLENMLYTLNPDFVGFMSGQYGYMARIMRCTQPIQGANMTVLAPGTGTALSSTLTDTDGYGLVYSDYGTYDVNVTLPDGSSRLYRNQVFN